MHRGEIQYARVGEDHVAFRELRGERGGEHEIVMVSGFFFPMDSLPEDPVANRLLEGLAELGRLIVFDRRGIALSDPITDWDTPLYQQWAEDLAAVIEAAGCNQPSVFSWHLSAVARTCSVLHPGLIGRLILFNPGASISGEDLGWFTEAVASLDRLRAGELSDAAKPSNASRGDDPAYRAWIDGAGRQGASPSLAERISQKDFSDPPFDNSQIEVPTLVVSRWQPGSPVPEEFLRRTAGQIPGARHVALPDGDFMLVGLGVDDILAEVSRYLTGEARLPAPERQLAAILFTDLVDSTRRAAAVGDTMWRHLLDQHDAVTRTEVDRSGGQVVKMTGDGTLALLPSATGAIAAARGLRERLAHERLEVRIGIHVGEVDRRGEDVSGLAVNIAARVMACASAGQIFTTAIVAEIYDGNAFASVGSRQLKGIDGSWELFELVDGIEPRSGSDLSQDTVR